MIDNKEEIVKVVDNFNKKEIEKFNKKVLEEQELEDARIKNKRDTLELDRAKEQEYNDNLELFQSMYFDIIGDLNDILLSTFKSGRIGRNIVPNLNNLVLKINQYKKDNSSKLINLKPEDRQSLYTLSKKLNNNIKSLLIPTLTKDKNKQSRLKDFL